MDLEGNLKREINQKRQIRFTCVWNIKKHNKLVSKTKRQTHRYREQTSGCQQEEGRGRDNKEVRGKKGDYGII